MDLITQNAAIDAILCQYSQKLGSNFIPYRNHVYRVFNLCIARGRFETNRVLAAGAAFHDIGIWTHTTFDYLVPSVELALQYARQHGFSDAETNELTILIQLHHKLSKIRGCELAEAFRLADMTDLSWGIIPNNHPHRLISKLREVFPNKGFHAILTRLFFQNLLRHPFNPLPMYKW